MSLPFVDRHAELARLRRALTAKASALVCVYGRRRVGKSRLVAEVLDGLPAVYYLADERDEHLQRRSLAREIERLVPGFGRVEYPDWDALLDRWSEAAPAGTVLAIDELPYLVAAAPALPSILQRRIDRGVGRQHWLLCGSSQRMMHGVVLDAAAPLYGRAREVVKVEPLAFPYLADALRIRRAEDAVEAFATWGGVPRYWELAAGAASLPDAQRDLVLDPLGILHAEPHRLLLDELKETTQAHSILALIGQGCHRSSEIAGRLGRPATS
ncbi:MAG TPA: ATP-binding protein, partial [Kofleriaceae bacterium]|nr:ATP-binding protein [Kofleriaceae bacterium]